MTTGDLKKLSEMNREFREAVLARDSHKLIDCDQKFHLYLMSISKNPYLMKIIEELRLKTYPLNYTLGKRGYTRQDFIDEHQRMVQALRKKDKKQMDAIIEKRLNRSKKSYLEFLPQS